MKLGRHRDKSACTLCGAGCESVHCGNAQLCIHAMHVVGMHNFYMSSRVVLGSFRR